MVICKYEAVSKQYKLRMHTLHEQGLGEKAIISRYSDKDTRGAAKRYRWFKLR